MLNYKDLVKKMIGEIVEEEVIVSNPPSNIKADLSVPCFTLNIDDIKNPNEKANAILSKLEIDNDLFSKVEVLGPYINFTINKDTLAIDLVKEINEKKHTYGSNNIGNGEDMLIEHTSINPNASPHIGRSRNSIIGSFLTNLFEFEGYNVEKHYFINDIGKQISMLLVGVLKYGDIKKISFDDILDLYVRINEESKNDPEVEKEVFYYLNELENGNEEVREKFRELTDICAKGQQKIFKKMGISWDVFTRESDFVFSNKTSEILNKLDKAGKLKSDENGRLYVDLTGYDIPTKSPVLVLTREDKTSLYPLRDIAYTIYKIERNSDNNFIVLGEDQEVYMKQISAVLDILGYKSPQLVSYSFVLLNGNKMATREGKVVLLEDFIDETKNKLTSKLNERNSNLESEKIESLAASCIKYNMLNINRKRIVNFNLEDATNFQGDSAIYLIYNYARINSILDKCNSNININDLKFNEEIEEELIKKLYDFKETVDLSFNTKESVVITNYLHELSMLFSKYYENVSILKEEDEILKNSRIELIKCIKTVLENGMKILGIVPVKKL